MQAGKGFAVSSCWLQRSEADVTILGQILHRPHSPRKSDTPCKQFSTKCPVWKHVISGLWGPELQSKSAEMPQSSNFSPFMQCIKSLTNWTIFNYNQWSQCIIKDPNLAWHCQATLIFHLLPLAVCLRWPWKLTVPLTGLVAPAAFFCVFLYTQNKMSSVAAEGR